MAMPATNARPRNIIRASTAAASARTSSSGPSVSVSARPLSGARQIELSAAMAPASAHTPIAMRLVGMPASLAASAVLGRGPHGQAEAREAQEQRDGHRHGRDEPQDQQVACR